MIKLERTDEEPCYPEDDMTDEEYEAYCEKIDKEEGARDDYYEYLRKSRMEDR